MAMNVKKGDTVIVLSGKDKGKQGKVLIADPKGMKVTVEGVNVATKHQKPQRQGQDGAEIIGSWRAKAHQATLAEERA